MSNILALFTKRDTEYDNATEAIMESLSHVLLGIDNFLVDTGSKPSKSDIVWQEAMCVLDTPTHGDFIILMGTMVVYDDDISEMDNSVNHPTENRVIKIGIPLDIAENGNEVDVFDFLESLVIDSHTLDTEANDDTVGDLFSTSALREDDPSFDINALTEEQRESLELFTATHGSKHE